MIIYIKEKGNNGERKKTQNINNTSPLPFPAPLPHLIHKHTHVHPHTHTHTYTHTRTHTFTHTHILHHHGAGVISYCYTKFLYSIKILKHNIPKFLNSCSFLLLKKLIKWSIHGRSCNAMGNLFLNIVYSLSL